MTFFVMFFPAFGYLGIPKHYKTRENAKCQIDCCTPPKYHPPYRETGVAIPLSHCVILWYRGLSLLHPHFFP